MHLAAIAIQEKTDKRTANKELRLGEHDILLGTFQFVRALALLAD